MKKKGWIWTIVSLVVVVAIVIGASLFIKGKGAATVDGGGMEDMPVTVQKVKEEVLSESILVTGTIVPEGEEKVYAEPEKGEIVEFKVEENSKVKAGDPLFIYDSEKLKREFERAVRERDLIKKRANTEEKQIKDMDKQIAAAKKKVGKVIDPEVDMEPPVTKEDVNQLENEKVQMEIQLEGTKAEITSAQEQINEIDAQIKSMTVTTKMDGVVVKVNPDAAAQTEMGGSEPIIHIISSEPYKVIGTMNEFDAVKIQNEQQVIIRPKVYKDREWKGVVESVSQFPSDGGGDGMEYDMGGGGNVTTYPFKVAITDDTSELRHGFHVSLEVKIEGDGKSLVVPHTAIWDDGEESIVFVLVEGLLERRPIQTGAMNDEFIEITQGVENGELVVIDPNPEMFDGMEVSSFDEIE